MLQRPAWVQVGICRVATWLRVVRALPSSGAALQIPRFREGCAGSRLDQGFEIPPGDAALASDWMTPSKVTNNNANHKKCKSIGSVDAFGAANLISCQGTHFWTSLGAQKPRNINCDAVASGLRACLVALRKQLIRGMMHPRHQRPMEACGGPSATHLFTDRTYKKFRKCFASRCM